MSNINKQKVVIFTKISNYFHTKTINIDKISNIYYSVIDQGNTILYNIYILNSKTAPCLDQWVLFCIINQTI